MNDLNLELRAILGFGLMEMEVLAGVNGSQKCGLELLFEQVERAEHNAELEGAYGAHE